MKRALAAIIVLLTLLISLEARGDVAFIVSAANLQDLNGVPIPTNALVLLVADTGGDGFSKALIPTTPLSVGSFLAGTDKPANDQIVAAWDLSSLGTAGQLLDVAKIVTNAFIINGQAVALYWFPSLTLTSTTAGAGTHFGFYTDATGKDGSAPWATSSLSIVNLNQLNFYTLSRGGLNPNGAGKASLQTLPDLATFQAWQTQYFGDTNNPNAAPSADATGSGQNNLFKYTAGLDPTNPSSVFVVNTAGVTNQPAWQDLMFNPITTGRIYTLQFSTDLVMGVWSPLDSYTDSFTNGNQITTTDTNAVQPQKFYRINISLP